MRVILMIGRASQSRDDATGSTLAREASIRPPVRAKWPTDGRPPLACLLAGISRSFGRPTGEETEEEQEMEWTIREREDWKLGRGNRRRRHFFMLALIKPPTQEGGPDSWRRCQSETISVQTEIEAGGPGQSVSRSVGPPVTSQL